MINTKYRLLSDLTLKDIVDQILINLSDLGICFICTF